MRLGLESAPSLGGPPASPVNRRDLFVSLAIFVVAFWSQRWVLNLPLTAIDTMPTLAAARAHGAWEFLEVLTRELRGDATTGGYYRPLTLVSYTLDQWIWGGSAWGYHFTDVALHALAAVAVYWLARAAVELPRLAAALAAAIFIAHPVIIEVVPAIARREEALIVTGFCLAAIGGRWLPRRVGWLLMVLGSIIAVTAAERGLAVPGVVFSHLLFYRFAASPPARRLYESVRWTLPVGAVAVGFFVLRAVLHGGGGIDPSPGGFYWIPVEFAMLLLYPQQMVDIVAPSGAIMSALYVLVALGLGAAFVLPVLGTRRRSLVWFAMGWVATYVALISVAGIFFAWYVYPAVPALALVISFFATESCRLLAARGVPSKLRGALAGGAGLVLSLALIVPSPLLRSYPAWRVGSSLSERFLHELQDLGRDAGPDDTIVIFNLPAHYCEARADYLVTRSAAILWPSSVEVWRREHLQDVDVTVIGCSNFVGGIQIPKIEFTDDSVRIYFEDGYSSYTNAYRAWPEAKKLPESVGRGYEFPWPAEVRLKQTTRMFLFDGERLVPLPG